MSEQSMTERNDERTIQSREETRASDKYFRPPVNIIETEDGLVLTADVPGAIKEQLDVNVEKGILTINAPAAHRIPGTSIYREFELANYYRQFSIPESLDHEQTSADYVNGILTLRIPRAAKAKAKRIEVKIV